MAIIGGAPDLDEAHDIAAILGGAEAVAGRIMALERLVKEAGAAIVTLGESASGSQHTARNLSADLAKLHAHTESDRNEIAGLHQRIELAEQSLGQRLAKVGEAIESSRNEITQLNQRIESTDQSLAQGLARVDESIESGRNEIARLHQRIASTDRAFTQGLTTLGERAVTLRDGLGRIHERLESVESSTALQAGIHKKIEVLGQPS